MSFLKLDVFEHTHTEQNFNPGESIKLLGNTRLVNTKLKIMSIGGAGAEIISYSCLILSDTQRKSERFLPFIL